MAESDATPYFWGSVFTSSLLATLLVVAPRVAAAVGNFILDSCGCEEASFAAAGPEIPRKEAVSRSALSFSFFCSAWWWSLFFSSWL